MCVYRLGFQLKTPQSIDCVGHIYAVNLLPIKISSAKFQEEYSLQSWRNFSERVLIIFLTKIMTAIFDTLWQRKTIQSRAYIVSSFYKDASIAG